MRAIYGVAAFVAVCFITNGCAKPNAQAAPTPQAATATVPETPLVFHVTVPAHRLSKRAVGRLMVILAPDGETGDLRPNLDDVEEARRGAAFGTDAVFSDAGESVTLNPSAKTVAVFPATGAKLAPGTYRLQAVFAHNPDLRGADAPGTLFSKPESVTIGGSKPVEIVLSEREPDEALPAETATVKWVKWKSARLSAFHKRPIFLRAGVVLPPGYAPNPAKPLPLCVRIGGFHTRYTSASRINPYPGIVQVMLDGDGVFGDSYSTNSKVSGAYGDATVRELLPVIEKRFACGGAANRRFTVGGSTGGWVSLALQIYYPEIFGGCWSGYPDPLDFRAYQNINLYTDANAYTNADGSERASARDVFTGQTKWTVREECALENVRGFGGSYVTSGGQWGAWNTVWGAPDKTGRTVPFWNPQTGAIDHAAAKKAGERGDLRRFCAANWKTLAPKLSGKIHLWVGERDDYFLNGGVHRFDDFLKTATPRIKYRAEYSPVAGHGWEPRSRSQVLDEMLAASKAR